MANEESCQDNRSFAYVFYACLSMGLFYCWINLNGTSEGAIFGLPFTPEGPYTMAVHSILFRASIGLGFLMLSFTRDIFANERKALVLSAGLGVLSTALSWCSALVGPIACAISAVVSGVALALFTSLWLAHYRCGIKELFIMLLLTSVVSGLFLPCIALFGAPVAQAASILLPPAAALAFIHSPQNAPNVCPTTPLPQGPRLAVQATVLLLLNFASGPAAYGMLAAGESAPQVARAISLILAAALGLRQSVRNETLVAFSALAVCLCIAPALVFEQAPSWLPPLMSAAFWVITKYSIAWFALSRAATATGLAPTSLRGLAAVYLLTSLAEVVGMQVSHHTACAIALVAIGLALAIALVDATQTSQTPAEPAPDSSPSMPDSPKVPQAGSAALDALATRASFTANERSVFEYLARGYSLKEIARQLNLTEGGAKYHRHNVYQKLGVTSRQELINLVESWEEPRAI